MSYRVETRKHESDEDYATAIVFDSKEEADAYVDGNPLGHHKVTDSDAKDETPSDTEPVTQPDGDDADKGDDDATPTNYPSAH